MRYDFVHAWGGASLAAIATLSSYKSMESVRDGNVHEQFAFDWHV